MDFKYFLPIYIIANLFVFALYGIDKYKAVHNKWRISEKALLLTSFAFAAPGALLGMKIFHHKTHKWYFWAVGLIGLVWQGYRIVKNYIL